jgi:hypothetical protein
MNQQAISSASSTRPTTDAVACQFRNLAPASRSTGNVQSQMTRASNNGVDLILTSVPREFMDIRRG